jgi:hypothetical protein
MKRCWGEQKMKGISSEIKQRQNVKDLIEEMREELRIERGEKLKSPAVKPKDKPKAPVNPNPKRPKKPKKRNIFAKKWVRK